MREILIYFVVVVVVVTHPLRRHNANRIHVYTSPFLLVLLFSFVFFEPHLFSLSFPNFPYAGSIAKNGAAPSFVALFSRRPETGQRWPTLMSAPPLHCSFVCVYVRLFLSVLLINAG